ncbi:MAG: acetate--CoA ligase family protein [Alcaligenes sp.]|nr:acetate--CoA ligase family protein [Alcaligenes sp.]
METVTCASTLDALLDPASIALVGASEDQSKFGGRLFRMLLKHGYGGKVLPINPSRSSLFGLPAVPSLATLDSVPDLAVFTVGADTVLEQAQIAAQMGVRGLLVISAGFADAGERGLEREQALLRICRDSGMRLIGPNCLGMISPSRKLVLCSSPVLDRDSLPERPIGFVSQSGALMTTYFDRAWAMGGGFTYGFSVGNQADLDLCDFVDFLIDDPQTRVICTYIEGIKDAQALRRTARRAQAAGKPWLAVKAGRSSAGKAAAFSHTASVAGDHDVFASVCRDEGISLMDDMGAMLLLANSMVRFTSNKISNVAIVTPSGGGGALAADALAEHGVGLSTFSASTQTALAKHYPAGQADNPVDLGARLTQDSTEVAHATLDALMQDPQSDAVLITASMCPQEWMAALIQKIIKPEPHWAKPVMVAFDAGDTSGPLRQTLAQHGHAYASSSLEAALALSAWKRHGQFVARQPALRPSACQAPTVMPRGVLNEDQSKRLLAHYGLPVNLGQVCEDVEQAVAQAEQIGYPLVMKIVSPDIVHKTEAGGVALDVSDEATLRRDFARLYANAKAYKADARLDGVLVQAMAKGDVELLIGARQDAQFGPVVVFGAGGILVELLSDRVIAAAPLTLADADRLLSTLTIDRLLKGYRGRMLDRAGVLDAIVRVSFLAHDLRDTSFELDINPLIVASTRCHAVDARLSIGE